MNVADLSRLGGTALSALAFGLLATFPGWHEERDERTGSDVDIKPFPSKPVSQMALFALLLSSIFMLTSSLWQHCAAAASASMISTVSKGDIRASVGPAAAALGWVAFMLVVIPFLGLLVMVISINILDALTDD
jgi:hypothetical protein